MPDSLFERVTDIVSAHVSNNSVAMSDLPGLIESVYNSLSSLGKPAEPVEEIRTPAVSVRSSVKPDSLTCLDCGAKMKMLKRHIRTDHGLSPEEYRLRWSLSATYPMVAMDYADKRRALAVSAGLGRKPGQTLKKIKAASKAKSSAAKKPRRSPKSANTTSS